MGNLTQKQLRQLVDYDPNTGVFTWRVTLCGRAVAGSKAGGHGGQGYVMLQVCKRRYGAHRLAWLYVYGELPTQQVDHINGNRSDNRINNLRLATNSQNQGNRSINCNSQSGHKGVQWSKQKRKWKAVIQISGERKFLGLFDTVEDAGHAYRRAAKSYFGEYSYYSRR